MSRSDLAALKLFAEVATARSFRAAARSLELSPSAVSHAVSKLEAQLGVRLLARTTRSVAPTAEGQALLAQLDPAFRLIEEAVADLETARETPTGHLRISLPRVAAATFIGPRLGAFAQAFPDIVLELVVDDAFVDIVAGRFDAGIRLGESLAQDMIVVRPATPQRLVVVAAPSVLEGYDLPRHPRDLIGRACIRARMPDGSLYAWEFERSAERISPPLQGPVIVNDDLLLLQAVRAGAGIGLVFEDLAREDLAAGRLVPLLEDWTPPFEGFCIYYPGRRHVRPALRAFIDVFAR